MTRKRTESPRAERSVVASLKCDGDPGLRRADVQGTTTCFLCPSSHPCAVVATGPYSGTSVPHRSPLAVRRWAALAFGIRCCQLRTTYDMAPMIQRLRAWHLLFWLVALVLGLAIRSAQATGESAPSFLLFVWPGGLKINTTQEGVDLVSAVYRRRGQPLFCSAVCWDLGSAPQESVCRKSVGFCVCGVLLLPRPTAVFRKHSSTAVR
jgi:hypothetical protein